MKKVIIRSENKNVNTVINFSTAGNESKSGNLKHNQSSSSTHCNSNVCYKQ